MPKTKICIVDDNEAVCNALRFLFDAHYELEVTIYNDPLLFLEEFSFDWHGLFLIDLFMPSINGLDVTKILKKRCKNMKILIMSGHASASMASQALKAGADGFILKPFKIETLLEQIDLILHFVRA